jgi:hypothetical protein
MMSDTDTNGKMDKILDQITEIKVNCAVMAEKMANISDRIEIINHNSTELATRVTAIEGRLKTRSDYWDFVKKLATTIAGMAAFTLAIVTVLHLCSVI